MHDVLIRNALVLDGNDRPGRHGDVAVRDGRIRRGELLLLEGIGGGFAWGSALLHY